MKSTNNKLTGIGEIITAIGAVALGVIGIVGKVESMKSNNTDAEFARMKNELAKKQRDDRALRRAEVEAAELNAKVKVAEHNRVSAPKIIG